MSLLSAIEFFRNDFGNNAQRARRRLQAGAHLFRRAWFQDRYARTAGDLGDSGSPAVCETPAPTTKMKLPSR
jgi:hypothetical protein